MSFLHPILLFGGLAAVAIPVLIHLLMRRPRKPVRWGAMRFLIEAYRKQRRRRRIERLVLLAARCLLVAALAVAVARPIFGRPGSREAQTLVVVIDNSLTASLTDEGGRSALERHLERAGREIDGLSPSRGDRVAVVLGARPVSAVVAPATLSRDGARRVLEEIAPTASGFDLAGALSEAARAIPGESASARVLVLSEWREGGRSEAGAGPDPAWPIAADRVVVEASTPAEGPAPNLRVTGFEPGRAAVFPGDTPSAMQAVVTIEREGETLPEIAAVLRTEMAWDGGASSAEEAVVLPEGRRSVSVAVGLPMPAADEAELMARAAVSGAGDRIAGDSEALRVIRLREAVRAGIVHSSRATRALGGFEAADWARLALSPDASTPVRVSEFNAAGLREGDLAGLDIAVLTRPDLVGEEGWSALASFVARGSSLVVFPPAEAVVHRWSDEMRSRLGIDAEFGREASAIEGAAALVPGPAAGLIPAISGEIESLARGVGVFRVLPASVAASSIVLRTEAGAPVLIHAAPRVWVFTAALDPGWTDLPAKPLLVPLVQEIARLAAGPSRVPTVTAGTVPDTDPSAIELVTLDGSGRVARAAETGRMPAIAQPGAWWSRGARGERLSLLAVTPDHLAGRTTPTPADQIAVRLGEAAGGATVSLGGGGDSDESRRAPEDDSAMGLLPFLIALLLAVFEALAARFVSHAGERGTGVAP